MRSIYYLGQKKRLVKIVIHTVRHCCITVEIIIKCIPMLGELANSGCNVIMLLDKYKISKGQLDD